MAYLPFTSRIITDTGISMGDEGKGRLIPEVVADLKAQTGRHDCVGMVLKVNGGANAGHTCSGLKLNLLPSGVPLPDVPVLALGSGVVADPRKLWWETAFRDSQGYRVRERLLIDERCMVSDLAHRLLDLAWESYRAQVLRESPRGSTGRGITPAYLDEVGQWQLFFSEFTLAKDAYALRFRQRIDRIIATIRHVCRVSPEDWERFFDVLTQAETRANREAIDAGVFDEAEFDFQRFRGNDPFTLNTDRLIDTCWEAGTRFRDRIGDVREAVKAILDREAYVIGEFGQSYWLDKRHGFTPNVTASHTFVPEIFQSAGLPVQPVHNIGICKAYDTKVGTHHFLTAFEPEHPLGRRLGTIEFGTSTGRQRMVGWFDAVEKGDVLRFGGCQDLMINKIDVLGHGDDWAGNLKICTHYVDTNGVAYGYVPRSDTLRQRLKPAYVELPGWREALTEVRSFADLPVNARRYIAWMVRATLDVASRNGTSPVPLPHVRYIGVGPAPEQIIRDVPPTPDLLALAADSALVGGET
ncbi:MAG: adenylosuccinate synthetase [Opitutales bacterium]